jgi:hypothetical protein
VMIYISNGSWELMFIRLTIEVWRVGYCGTKRRGGKCGISVGAVGVCGPCVCLGVFLLL